MTDSISAVSSASAASSTSSSSSTKLTAATKTQLEALGVDTTNITSETEGQTALKAAQAKSDAQQKAKAAAGGGSEDSIKASAQTLASEMGVSVSSTDTTDDILSNISAKLSELKASAGDDQVKLAELEQYQSEFDTLSTSYTNMQTSQAQLSNSMSGLATYNKASLNL